MVININKKNCNINHRNINGINKVMTTKKDKMIINIDTTFSIENKDINRNSSKVIIINNKMTTNIDKTSNINRNINMVMIIMRGNRIKNLNPDFPLTLPSLRRETREIHFNPSIPGR